MRTLFESGVLSKIKHGVKILGAGADRLVGLGIPISLEASDAAASAVEAVNQTGGRIRVEYRTPLIMR